MRLLALAACVALAATAEKDAKCGDVQEASDASEARAMIAETSEMFEKVTKTSYVFFDLEESMTLRDAPFNSKLPGAQAFLATLESQSECRIKDANLPRFAMKMEEAFWAAPILLADDMLPNMIANLQQAGHQVFGVAAQSKKWGKGAWAAEAMARTHETIDALAKFGVKFSKLPPMIAKKLGNNTKAGGVLFAGNYATGKMIAEALNQVVPEDGQVTLVHGAQNRIGGTIEALEAPLCPHGVVLTAAALKEWGDEARWEWVCRQLLALDVPCDICGTERDPNEDTPRPAVVEPAGPANESAGMDWAKAFVAASENGEKKKDRKEEL